MWNFLLPFENMQCVFVDLPGHGKSELNENIELTMSSIAESVIKLMRDLGIDSYDVIGHSMGGYVAMELKRINALCEKVILLNSNFWEDSETKKTDRKRVADLVQTKKEAFVQAAIPNLFMNPEGQAEEVNDLIREASQIHWRTIASSSIAMSVRNNNTDIVIEKATDFLIVQGKYDSTVTIDMMQKHTCDLDVSYYEIPSGHMAHIEHTVLVKDAIMKFLA